MTLLIKRDESLERARQRHTPTFEAKGVAKRNTRRQVGCTSLVGDVDSWGRGVAGFRRWMWLGVLTQGGGVI
jgi:hypothetical protein